MALHENEQGGARVRIPPPLVFLIPHYAALLPEEAYLDEKFGESYRAFKKRVRRYL